MVRFAFEFASTECCNFLSISILLCFASLLRNAAIRMSLSNFYATSSSILVVISKGQPWCLPEQILRVVLGDFIECINCGVKWLGYWSTLDVSEKSPKPFRGAFGGPKTSPNSDPNLKFRLSVMYPSLNLGAPLNIRWHPNLACTFVHTNFLNSVLSLYQLCTTLHNPAWHIMISSSRNKLLG